MRVNPPGTPGRTTSTSAACLRNGVGRRILPKAEDPDVVRRLRDRLGESRPEISLLLGIESAVGIARARELLAARRTGGYFGAEDFLADMGGVTPPPAWRCSTPAARWRWPGGWPA